jgi:hypothetical protein
VGESATTETQQSVEKVEAFFKPGLLSQKQTEAEDLLRGGHTVFFEGAVDWRVTLPEEYKTMKGRSETLGHAVADMLSSMRLLAEEYGDDAEVACGIGGDTA